MSAAEQYFWIFVCFIGAWILLTLLKKALRITTPRKNFSAIEENSKHVDFFNGTQGFYSGPESIPGILINEARDHD